MANAATYLLHSGSFLPGVCDIREVARVSNTIISSRSPSSWVGIKEAIKDKSVIDIFMARLINLDQAIT